VQSVAQHQLGIWINSFIMLLKQLKHVSNRKK
jgi:hypothetical protein